MKPVIFHNCYPDDSWRLGWVENISTPQPVKRLFYKGVYYPNIFLKLSMAFKFRYTNANNNISYIKHKDTHYFSIVVMGVVFLFEVRLKD